MTAPENYDAETAGLVIGKSANWMKTRARAGKIPYTRVGRSMRWTPEHLEEILRDGDQGPQPAPLPSTRSMARRTSPHSGASGIQANTPRRKRTAA